MEVLKRSKFILRLANLSNKRGFHLYKWRIPNVIVDSILLLPMSVCCLQMLIFCIKIGPSLRDISSSIYLCLGIVSLCAMYICLAVNNDLITATLDHLQDMVTLRLEKSVQSTLLYNKQEKRNAKLVKMLLIYASFVVINIFAPPLVFPISYAIFDVPKPKLWYLPYPTVVPFDTKKPIGFYTVLLVQFLSASSYMLLISLFSGIFIGMCTYIDACVTDLSTFVEELNEICKKPKSAENQKKIDELCSDMLQFHIDVLEVMKNLKIIMNGPLFFQLLVYAVFIAMNLLQFDETLKHFDFDILLNLNAFFTQLLFNYISCYYANNVTIKSFAATDIAYSIHWYTFPVKRQLLIKQMVQRAQKPFYLKGYDIVDCSLTTFLNFIKTAVSYYLVFKQFGN